MGKYFVIGDLHGNFEALQALLLFWNKDEEQLIFLGDYMDRGPQSLKVIQTVMALQKQYNAICLTGNHEEMFLDWLDEIPGSDLFTAQTVGGLPTKQNFIDMHPHPEQLNSISKVTQYIKENFIEEIDFLRKLKFFHQTASFFFVHAGIDTSLDEPTHMLKSDLLWIRSEFIFHPHLLDKTVVFGHTPTQRISENNQNGEIWLSPCNKKIGIDGGGFLPAGSVNAVKLNDDSKMIQNFRFSKPEKNVIQSDYFLD